MSARLLNDARHWRDRAAQIRALSDWMSDAQARARIFKLANDYDKLAEQAREGGVSPAQGPRQFWTFPKLMQEYLKHDGCLLISDDPSLVEIAHHFELIGKPVWRYLAEVPRAAG